MRHTGRVAGVVRVLLEVAWWGTAASLALVILFLFFTPWVDPPRIQIGSAAPVAVAVNTDVHALDDAAINAYLKTADAWLFFSPRSAAAAAAGLSGMICVGAIVLFVITQLRAVFRTLAKRQPFAPENAVRIRRIGWTFIIAAFVRPLLTYAGSYYAATHFTVGAGRLDTRWDFTGEGILVGLVILAIAEAFRVGTRLDEDQSLTV